MPGFTITEGWMVDSGIPHRGLLYLQYYSGEGQRKRGCAPLTQFRKALLALFLLYENEVKTEKERDRIDAHKGYIVSNEYIHQHDGTLLILLYFFFVRRLPNMQVGLWRDLLLEHMGHI